MKVLIVSIEMKPEYREQILKGVLEDASGAQHDEPGCLRFDVIQDSTDNNKIYLYEVYTSDQAFQKHLEAPHFRSWSSIPKEWFAAPTQIVRGDTISPHDYT
jgi:autoinducer 2-degrading protein